MRIRFPIALCLGIVLIPFGVIMMAQGSKIHSVDTNYIVASIVSATGFLLLGVSVEVKTK